MTAARRSSNHSNARDQLRPVEGVAPAVQPRTWIRSSLASLACTCGLAPTAVCSACRRFQHHADEVAARRAARGVK